MTDLVNNTDGGVGVDSLKAFLAEHPGYLVLDNTQLVAWEQCARKYEYVYRLDLAQPSSIPAEFSSVFVHPTIAQWYTDGTTPSPARWRELDIAFQTETGHLPGVGKYDKYYSVAIAQTIFQAYTHRYAVDREMYRFVTSEEVYWSILPGVDNVIWLSKPDLILRQADDSLMNVDLKVSAYDYNEQLIEFDRQFLGQAYAAHTAAMLKAHIRIVFDRSMRVSDITLTRMVKRVDQDLLREWLAEVQQSARHIQSDIASGVFAKRAPRACTDFNHTCAFMDLCDVAGTRHLLIDLHEKRNPRKYLGM